jgi:hypothetical protein
MSMPPSLNLEMDSQEDECHGQATTANSDKETIIDAFVRGQKLLTTLDSEDGMHPCIF